MGSLRERRALLIAALGFVRLRWHEPVPRVALALLVCVTACASPATIPGDAPVAGDQPPPRFATGGPDAEEFGADAGYPKGDRATFWNIAALVGSHSHLDEIFPHRIIHSSSAV